MINSKSNRFRFYCVWLSFFFLLHHNGQRTKFMIEISAIELKICCSFFCHFLTTKSNNCIDIETNARIVVALFYTAYTNVISFGWAYGIFYGRFFFLSLFHLIPCGKWKIVCVTVIFESESNRVLHSYACCLLSFMCIYFDLLSYSMWIHSTW